MLLDVCLHVFFYSRIVGNIFILSFSSSNSLMWYILMDGTFTQVLFYGIMHLNMKWLWRWHLTQFWYTAAKGKYIDFYEWWWVKQISLACLCWACGDVELMFACCSCSSGQPLLRMLHRALGWYWVIYKGSFYQLLYCYEKMYRTALMDDASVAWIKVTGKMFREDNPQQIEFPLLRQMNTWRCWIFLHKRFPVPHGFSQVL